MHGVRNEVVHSDDEQLLVSVHVGTRFAAKRNGDLVGVGDDVVLIHGLRDDRVDVDKFRLLECVLRLQPRQLDDLLGETGRRRA